MNWTQRQRTVSGVSVSVGIRSAGPETEAAVFVSWLCAAFGQRRGHETADRRPTLVHVLLSRQAHRAPCSRRRRPRACSFVRAVRWLPLR